ncbi:plasmid replication/partition related protein [Stenotrophomonas sp. HITSZ_GD]|uniref:plasmid replication/partition related protein n=1 Tax=Stenotrophomonas sp. HITSZ_GD TaxID=3037248 RepID=UPI00240E2C39|nr:plasmid replication/partition related protein [Stenotrophomonas sp. HITSZ_GD]MDG2524912.1 plasmid replication/partition related protein [Stenotrophomonas sp. HITSZ_GD]
MDTEIVVDPSLKAYIDPLTPDEHAALEQSLLAEGCRDALVLWGNVLVDGHNRYGICRTHGLPFRTMQNERFQSMEDVHLWMIDQHLGRRSVSDFQRGVLALRKREILAARRERAVAEVAPAEAAVAAPEAPEDDTAPWPEQTAHDTPVPAVAAPPSRQELARVARVSHSQLGMIEKIQRQAAPEVVEAVRSGALSINAAAVVATLPMEEQQAAAQAGHDELREAAKRARQSRRKPRVECEHETSPEDTLQSLRGRVAELEQENARLRERIAELEAR